MDRSGFLITPSWIEGVSFSPIRCSSGWSCGSPCVQVSLRNVLHEVMCCARGLCSLLPGSVRGPVPIPFLQELNTKNQLEGSRVQLVACRPVSACSYVHRGAGITVRVRLRKCCGRKPRRWRWCPAGERAGRERYGDRGIRITGYPFLRHGICNRGGSRCLYGCADRSEQQRADGEPLQR